MKLLCAIFGHKWGPELGKEGKMRLHRCTRCGLMAWRHKEDFGKCSTKT